jgi:hypothetical protein
MKFLDKLNKENMASFLVVEVLFMGLMFLIILSYNFTTQDDIPQIFITSFYALEIIGGMMALGALIIIAKTLIQGRQSY